MRTPARARQQRWPASYPQDICCTGIVFYVSLLTILRPAAAVQEYMRAKDRLVHLELTLMREFGFVLHVEHPHKFALSAALQLLRFPQVSGRQLCGACAWHWDAPFDMLTMGSCWC